jgi:retron-type reverse transcriptase
MKRHGNLFKKIVSIENLSLAYKKARKGKSIMKNVQKFELDITGNLLDIQRSLIEKSFSTSKYQSKWIHEPKQREIFVLPFAPDRIVQHALMNIIEPIWESLFIRDSYACIVGRGIHAGSRRTMEFVRRYQYCLKADISKFYPSIDQNILIDIVKKKIKCRDTLWLLQNIIYSYPGGKNVPIGNYTSKWFWNLYLNELDQFLKNKYHVNAYIRYCDDFCLFSDDKHWLVDIKEKIREFLFTKLKLQFSYAEVFPTRQGVDFLGYRHFKSHILVRKSTSKRIKKRIKFLIPALSTGKITIDQFRSSISSINGWLKWANSYNLKTNLDIVRLQQISNGNI